MTEAQILLAENNPDDVLLTRQAFAKSGFGNPITVVADGEACLELLLPGFDGVGGRAPAGEAAPEPAALRPALVLLDIDLPKIGGLEVLRRLRGDPSTRLLPVVILTTSQERGDIIDGYLLGANSYVCKPISFTRFVSVVHALGTYWLRINEPCPNPAVA